MDLDREPQKMAYAAAEEIRALNHRSLDIKAFYGEYNIINAAPNQVAGMVGGLYTLLERLPQSIQQASAALQHIEEQQAIRMANGDDPGEATSRALRALLDAKQAIQIAQTHLREASGVMSNMGGHFIDDDELEDADTAV
ncbi:hypothetical protein ACFVYE_32045 [Streptomyces sp. NPDC058239]|uniref:hypothetical protein n=1 Tax=Streptomyces sp. NPDC058239 TaxID=3346395 RepID=UPI0036E11C16